MKNQIYLPPLYNWPANLQNKTCGQGANVCQMTACWAHVHKTLEGKWRRKEVNDRTFAPEGTIICNSMTYLNSSTESTSREVDSLMKFIYIF